jgi:hypothetical protein
MSTYLSEAFALGRLIALAAIVLFSALLLSTYAAIFAVALLALIVLFAMARLWGSWRTWFVAPRHRRIRPLFAVLGLTILVACATAQSDEGKALSAAQDAVAHAASGVHAAYVAGVISKAQVTQASKLVDQADNAAIAARAAYRAGDSSTAAGAVAQITTLAAEIVALEKPATPGPVSLEMPCPTIWLAPHLASAVGCYRKVTVQ